MPMLFENRLLTNFVVILVLTVLIIFNTFMFFNYSTKLEFSVFVITMFCVLSATSLVLLSYFFGHSGIAPLISIPNTKRTHMIREDKNRALLFFILCFVCLAVFLGIFTYIRLELIKEKNIEYEHALILYEETVKYEHNISGITQPKYGGSKIFDLISIIVPFLSALLSIILGFSTAKKYTAKLEERKKQLHEDMELLKDRHEKEIIRLQNDLQEKKGNKFSEETYKGYKDANKISIDEENEQYKKERKAINDELDTIQYIINKN